MRRIVRSRIRMLPRLLSWEENRLGLISTQNTDAAVFRALKPECNSHWVLENAPVSNFPAPTRLCDPGTLADVPVPICRRRVHCDYSLGNGLRGRPNQTVSLKDERVL